MRVGHRGDEIVGSRELGRISRFGRDPGRLRETASFGLAQTRRRRRVFGFRKGLQLGACRLGGGDLVVRPSEESRPFVAHVP